MECVVVVVDVIRRCGDAWEMWWLWSLEGVVVVVMVVHLNDCKLLNFPIVVVIDQQTALIVVAVQIVVVVMQCAHYWYCTWHIS